MSGILGVWRSQQETPWQAMLDDLNVLGRDAQGDWHDAEVGLQLGRSQFFNTPESCLESPVVQSEGCVLVWDGRLDDRESLLMGRSQVTDAQLLIEAYRRWGVECLRHLTGEFSLILWDTVEQRLFVGCDAVGHRTLAYSWDGQTLLLSSRVVTLLLHPQVSHQFDPDYLAHTLSNSWEIPPGLTAFQAIRRLQPGQGLILQSGHLQIQTIANLTACDRYDPVTNPELYYDEFWSLMQRAISDRLRNHRPAYSTLSGGLDSTTVAVALVQQVSSLPAVSAMTEIFPDFDERVPIRQFLEWYPQIQWHPINCDDAWGLTEPWERLPAIDDPFFSSVLPMNLRLYEWAQSKGLGIQFGGNFGDEFCSVSLQDHLNAAPWSSLLKALKTAPRWQSVLFHQLLLPNLPPAGQEAWSYWRCRRSGLPDHPWLQPQYQQTAPLAAVQHYQSRMGMAKTHSMGMQQFMANTRQVGSGQLCRLLSAHYHVELADPFGDRRLIEFSSRLHPSLHSDPTYGKIFLRQANRKTLPEAVRLRPKMNCFTSLRHVALGEGEQALSLLNDACKEPAINSIINFSQFEADFSDYRKSYASSYVKGESFHPYLSQSMMSYFMFFSWFLNLKRAYGL
jgi:asparagine synthase (glutamine-hydrolysing)